MSVYTNLSALVQRSLVILLLSGAAVLSGCDTAPTADNGQRANQRGLDQTTAELRKSQISELSYQLDIALNEQGAPFNGEVSIDFTYTPQEQPLTIDFTNGTVSQLTLNGKTVTFDYNGFFISLEESLLTAGRNNLTVTYSHPYSSDGAGLYYFTDRSDGRIYTYSDLEPYDANRIFPLFDQPNLKATFALNVTAPAHWQIISNVREASIEEQGQQRLWRFPAGPVMSSYVFALHAGEYATIELDSFRDGELEIPLRLFARQSLLEHVPVEEWQQTTRHGFAFFNDFFGIDYPFGKYDQLAVPDFNSGAMENIGAVTFNDSYCCLPGKRTLSEQSFFKNAVLHELAHMWFGNLVTMNWWDDLWLNESFAEIAGYFALEAMQENSEAGEQLWTDFLWQRKTWGYRDDDYITSHPIRGEITHTDGVRSAIDGITYAKGGAVLRQLRHLLGDETFIQAIRLYMNQHAYSNTRYEDLLAAFSQAAGEDLGAWSQSWMKTIGVNRVAAEYQCDGDRLSQLSLIQSGSSNSSLLRRHSLDIALYHRDESGALVSTLVAAQLNADKPKTTVNTATTQACPLLVLPNSTDIAFIKVLLDERSVAALPALFAEINSPLQRSLLWIALADSVTDGASSVSDYIQLAFSQLPGEQDLQILTGVTRSLGLFDSYLERIAASDGSAAAIELRDQLRQRARQMALEGMRGKDPLQQTLWFDFYRALADSSQVEQIESWLQSDQLFERPADARDRWLLLALLGQFHNDNIETQLEKEKLRDPSARGHRYYLRAKAAAADNEHKITIIGQVNDPANEDSLANRRALLSGVRYATLDGQTNSEIADLLVDRVLTGGGQLDAGVEDFYARALIPGLYTCQAQWSARMSNRLAAYSTAGSVLINAMKESRQNNQRCMAVRKRLASEG
ncbi:aminopeptidase N [Porticoccaceae bacterium]|nr:aminopeptidase N [Porticoccaceae bacterium]